MPWERIPKELLLTIFDNLKWSDAPSKVNVKKQCLFQVMLTCKHWSRIAKEAFYDEQFKIDIKTANKLITDTTIQQLPLKNIFVSYELASDAILTKLLSMCPNLNSLCVEDWTIGGDDSATGTNLYKSLINLSRSKHLSKLRKVEFDIDRAFTNQVLVHHQQAMLELKQSLTDLQITDTTSQAEGDYSYMEPPKLFVEWFDFLKGFPRLTTVKFDVGCLFHLYEVDRFIQKIGPKVSNLSIHMNYIAVLQPIDIYNPATITRRHAPLETLKIDMPYLIIEDIHYILHKFDSVCNLHVDLWGTEYNEDIAHTKILDLSSIRSADTFRQFIDYLTRIPTFLITNLYMSNSHLRQTLMDLKKRFHVKHLTMSNYVDLVDTSMFSIKSLSEARDGQRRQINLDLEIGTAQLLSVAKVVYELLKEDVEELQFRDGLIEHLDDDFDDYPPCSVQGEALKLGIDLLPFLKVLRAKNVLIGSFKTIVNPQTPKLSLDFLQIDSFTNLEALFQLSQRVKSIKRWEAPELAVYNYHYNRQRYVLNMPFTTFDEISIDSERINSFIVKLSTSSSTTFHGVGLNRHDQTPTEADYYQKEEVFIDLFKRDLDPTAKVTITCANVKELNVAETTIKITN